MKEFNELIKIVETLRSPKGCPWDRAQKVDDLKKYLLEEVYELFEAIDSRNLEAVTEELGDLFLLLVFIVQVYKEKKNINLSQVLSGINNKLLVRHPHVFSDKKLKNKEDVLNYWIRDKAKKKKRKTIRDRLPATAPALFLANLFFRELSKIEPANKSCKDRDCQQKRKLIQEELDHMAMHKPTKKTFQNMLFAISSIATSYDYDLEDLLKTTILKAAQKAKYKTQDSSSKPQD